MDLFVGLMSGTSMDGVDAALLRTDGERAVPVGFLFTPYDEAERETIRSALRGRGDVAAAERVVTDAHIRAVERIRRPRIRAVGFHGHTIDHRPDEGRTRQIGDAERLARQTGLAVVADFRSADMAAGGQGAPLAPVYHRALLRKAERPTAVLNIGGVANVTWIGHDGTLLAFDTGPGNALIDDWCRQAAGVPMDRGGALAEAGEVDRTALAELLDHPYFERPPPKSLDRMDFSTDAVTGLSATDGAATLTAFTAEAVARAPLPEPPAVWIVSGGGRRNRTLMRSLPGPVRPAEACGWNGDAIEAEAFAFLAARRMAGLPISFPGTTGSPEPMTGGRLFEP